MRQIEYDSIREAVKTGLIKANCEIGDDVLSSLVAARNVEESPVGISILDQLVENDRLAAREGTALCQDTGMVIAFADLGQDARIVGGDFREAIDEGVREAYREAFFRNSVVRDPLFDRKNTGDNTPSVIHVDIVPGDRLRISLMAKGFGSENMSALRMLTPADGEEGVRRFVVDTVRSAGPNPCPPVIVGVGVGGTFEQAALISKRALLRELGRPNADPRYAELERRLLSDINGLGVGPGGLGGRVTALAVHVEQCPTHIASIPVAVNMCCHASRHARIEL